jgi:hypothetical protein
VRSGNSGQAAGLQQADLEVLSLTPRLQELKPLMWQPAKLDSKQLEKVFRLQAEAWFEPRLDCRTNTLQL